MVLRKPSLVAENKSSGPLMKADCCFDDHGYMDPQSIEYHAGRPRPRTFGIEVGVTFD